MSRSALSGARILAGAGFVTGAAVVIADGRIAAVVRESEIPPDCERVAVNGDLLPGFIDCQVNGGGGVLFNDQPTVAGIRAIAAAHRRGGTTGFLPTLISDRAAVMERAIDAVEEAIAAGVPGVLGIHLEGPYLNPARAGIHDRGRLARIGEEDMDRLTRLRGGKTVITLAPECVPEGTIEKLTGRGAIVCAGHSAATFAETNRALDAGLAGFTHLFNAMTPLTSREPGMVGAALSHRESWCGLIADLHHVHPATIALALRTKPFERFMLVSDAMPTVGSDKSSFMLGDTPVSAADGRLTGPDGTLAGAHLDLATAVRNVIGAVGLTPQAAAAMASAAPAAFLGMGATRGRIAPGFSADLVLVDRCAADGMDVLATWIGGVRA